MEVEANGTHDGDCSNIRVKEEVSLHNNDVLWPTFYHCHHNSLNGYLYLLVTNAFHSNQDTLDHESVGDEGSSKGDKKNQRT